MYDEIMIYVLIKDPGCKPMYARESEVCNSLTAKQQTPERQYCFPSGLVSLGRMKRTLKCKILMKYRRLSDNCTSISLWPIRCTLLLWYLWFEFQNLKMASNVLPCKHISCEIPLQVGVSEAICDQYELKTLTSRGLWLFTPKMQTVLITDWCHKQSVQTKQGWTSVHVRITTFQYPATNIDDHFNNGLMSKC